MGGRGGPGDEWLVLDLDSFVGAVHGYAKEGAAYGYIPAQAWRWLDDYPATGEAEIAATTLGDSG